MLFVFRMTLLTTENLLLYLCMTQEERKSSTLVSTLKNVNPGFQGPFEGFFENMHQSSAAMDLWCHGMAGILNLFIFGKSLV